VLREFERKCVIPHSLKAHELGNVTSSKRQKVFIMQKTKNKIQKS
jgi:hypothetical protein